MKRVLKWTAGLVCTIAIVGSIVFSPLGHGGPKTPIAGHGGPKTPIAGHGGPKTPIAGHGGPKTPVF
ncbi:MAG TPA: hypothetical protein VNW73_11240 [Ktedonobacteraceae bacterium]|nr:hypothetical protein [Ktedonobacteraceae bacterium]